MPGTIKVLQCSLRHFAREARSHFGSWRVRQIDACGESLGEITGLPVIELDKSSGSPDFTLSLRRMGEDAEEACR